MEPAALSDEKVVPQAVAKALNVREVPSQALSETLASYGSRTRATQLDTLGFESRVQIATWAIEKRLVESAHDGTT